MLRGGTSALCMYVCINVYGRMNIKCFRQHMHMLKGERGKGEGAACPIGHKLPLIGARLKTHFMDNNLSDITFCQRSSKTN